MMTDKEPIAFTIFCRLDINRTISQVQTVIQHAKGQDIANFSFWNRDEVILSPRTTRLADLCHRQEGIVDVTINVCFDTRKFILVDVTEAAVNVGQILEKNATQGIMYASSSAIVDDHIELNAPAANADAAMENKDASKSMSAMSAAGQPKTTPKSKHSDLLW